MSSVNPHQDRSPRRSPIARASLGAILLAGLTLAGCTTPAGPAGGPAPQPRPSPDVQFYPKQGQSAAQQDRDRYECHLWAVKKTGYDPSAEPRRSPAPATREDQQGSGALAGAIIGGAIGAATSRDEDRGINTFMGATTGAMIGAASDAEKQRAAQQRAAMEARFDERVLRYRRAMTACLEGRGYAVR
jgi:hypothetical protein